LNRNTHDQASNIFKLISGKETSQLGLKQLYDYKERHPEVDVQPFLRGASQFFQNFINNGLAELQRLSQNNRNNNPADEATCEAKPMAVSATLNTRFKRLICIVTEDCKTSRKAHE